MRKAFANALIQAAESDPRMIFLTADLGFGTFDEFQKRFGPRYVNVGVAEANMVCAAAGLALEGWRPVIYSIASFATGRPFEQIRVNLGYMGLPVVVVGAGGGYTYASSGVTHHAGEDLGLMSLIPGMTVVAPGAPHEVEQLLPQMLQLSGPSYIRVGKYGEPEYQAADEKAVLGTARLLQDGGTLALVSTGQISSVALEAAALLNAQGLRPLVCHFHTVQPLDTRALETIAEKVSMIVVVEEHIPVGGLFAGISAWRAGLRDAPRVMRIGPPQALVLGNPSLTELRQRFSGDAAGIAETCMRYLAKDASAVAA